VYTIGTSVTITSTGARGTIVGVEVGDDGSYSYKIKYTQPDGNVVREVLSSIQFTL
jgi:hypothetical protein